MRITTNICKCFVQLFTNRHNQVINRLKRWLSSTFHSIGENGPTSSIGMSQINFQVSALQIQINKLKILLQDRDKNRFQKYC